MNINENDIYGPEMEVDYEKRPFSKFADFNDNFLAGKLTSEKLTQKLTKEKYAPHIQQFAQMLWNINETAPQIISVLPEPWMVKRFVTGLLHNETMLKPLYKHSEDIIYITDIVKKALEISNDTLKPTLNQELVSLDTYQKQLIEKLKRIKDASIESELDYEWRRKCVNEPLTVTLEWDDLMTLHSSGLGLRHISSVERGKREFNQGCTGDAISIQNGVAGNICQLLVERKITSDWTPPDDFFLTGERDESVRNVQDLFNFMTITQSLSKEDKRKVVNQFEKSLWSWISFSIFNYDNQIDLLSPKKNYISKRIEALTSSSTFLLINECETSGNDFKAYNHFGKCGKSYIAADRMKLMISIPKEELERSCEESKDKSITALLIAVDRAALLSVYKQVIQAIRKQ